MGSDFRQMLAVGGKSNSLGLVDDVIQLVLNDKSRLDELYACLFAADPWARMRAADAFEKICRHHPEWMTPYLDRFPEELATSTQPSIQWHLAQIYRQAPLSDSQRAFAIEWLRAILSSPDADWIVAANAMQTLTQFTQAGDFSCSDLIALLEVQQQHHSKSVVRRARKLTEEVQHICATRVG